MIGTGAFLAYLGIFDIPEAILTRASSFILIISLPTVVIAYYWWLPRVGAALAQGFLSGMFQKSKMTELSEKGVAARQQQAQKAAETALVVDVVTATDPLKGIAIPLIEGFAQGAIDEMLGSLPAATRRAIKEKLSAALPAAIANSNVNFTQWAVQGLDQKFPAWQLKQKLNALGVITSAEKIA